MVVKVKESFEKTRQVENNDKSKKYFLRGERTIRYHDRILSQFDGNKTSHNLMITKRVRLAEQ